MPTVAEQLRSAREAMGLTVHQVAEITKIRTDHIRALESAEYETFVAPVYIRGFVRTYARLVHLDPQTLIRELEAELQQTGQFQEPANPLGERTLLDLIMLQLSKVNWRVALPSLGVALAVLLVILGYRAWMHHRTRDPLADLGPGLHQPAQTDPGDTLPLPSPPPQ